MRGDEYPGNSQALNGTAVSSKSVSLPKVFALVVV